MTSGMTRIPTPRPASPLLDLVDAVVAAAGKTEEFTQAGHFRLEVPNDPYMALVIESWPSPGPVVHPEEKRRILVAHYNGDGHSDPRVELTDRGQPIELVQLLDLVTPVVLEVAEGVMFNTRYNTEVREFLADWATNLREQGFIEAARKQATIRQLAAGPNWYVYFEHLDDPELHQVAGPFTEADARFESARLEREYQAAHPRPEGWFFPSVPTPDKATSQE